MCDVATVLAREEGVAHASWVGGVCGLDGGVDLLTMASSS